jgi:site-specific recombinase XerC
LRDGARSIGLRHALAAAYQSLDDLPTNSNLRAVQLLLGHTKVESTVRYLGIDVDDALVIAEQVEI